MFKVIGFALAMMLAAPAGAATVDFEFNEFYQGDIGGPEDPLIVTIPAVLGYTAVVKTQPSDPSDVDFYIFQFSGFAGTGLLVSVFGSTYSPEEFPTLSLGVTGTPTETTLKVVLSSVPVPAGALLLGTGLAGLGFLRRRRA